MRLQYERYASSIDYAGIKAAVSMVAVLEDYSITPQKRKIRCPFHNDQHPSMQIYPDGYYCFSCGNGGDIFNFVAQMESVTIKQAAALIMARHGLSYGVANPAIQRRLNAERKAQQELEQASNDARDALCAARRADGGTVNEWDYWLDYLDEDPKGFFDNGGKEVVKRAQRIYAG